MSKRARHQLGFYASLFDDVYDHGLSYKCRPKQNPVVMGVYEVERIVSKRNQGGKEEYFIQWKNYPSTENTWEHDVLRAIFPGMPSELRGSPYLASEEEMIAAGLGPCLKKCLTITGGGCPVDAPVYLKLFLGKSLSFLDEQGRKTAPRPVEKVQIKFSKSYFAGRIQ